MRINLERVLTAVVSTATATMAIVLATESSLMCLEGRS
jgi:hypothetical protein